MNTQIRRSRNGATRRPKTEQCYYCAGPMSLIDCGVREHGQRGRTAQQVRDDECTGYVYAHDETGFSNDGMALGCARLGPYLSKETV